MLDTAQNMLKTLAWGTLVLAAAASALFCSMQRGQAALGVWTGALWMFANLYFLMRLVEIGMAGAAGRKDRVFALSLVKFPVLYAAGFFILKSRFFPLSGILTGLTVVMAAFTIAWTRTMPRPGKVA